MSVFEILCLDESGESFLKLLGGYPKSGGCKVPLCVLVKGVYGEVVAWVGHCVGLKCLRLITVLVWKSLEMKCLTLGYGLSYDFRSLTYENFRFQLILLRLLNTQNFYDQGCNHGQHYQFIK